MPKMSDREVLALVKAEFSSSMGAPGGELSTERAKAWKYYRSEKLGNEVDGQSQVVTSDVADVVDGLMPSLLRAFTTKDNLVSFDPVGPEDIPLAMQESDYVNHEFFKMKGSDLTEDSAFLVLYTWMFDALTQKNGIVKAWWDESEITKSESYSGLDEAELIKLLGDDELEATERNERVVDGVTVHDIEFKRTTKKGRLRVENVPPEEYRVSSDTKTLFPGSGRMVGQERLVTRSDLVVMGIDKEKVYSLPTEGGGNVTGNEKTARYNKTDELSAGFADKSQELVKVSECYIKMDYSGTGKSELRQIMVSGNEVLVNDPADRQPFHILCPKPLPHKHFGSCPAEDVMDIQEVSTTLLRQSLDNLYMTNNPEHNVWEQGIGETTIDDLLTRKLGKINRFERPPAEAHSINVVPFTAESSMSALSYFDKVKRDRTGVNADSEGLSPEQLKNIQSTVMSQANDLSRMKIETIVRVFAETGIKSLFLHIRELLMKHQDKAKMVELRNEWVEVNPSEWRTRENTTINIGLGVGTKDANRMHLNEIWDKQAIMIQNGGLNRTVTEQNVYNTAAEIVKNANFKNADMFFTNPANQPEQEGQESDPQADAIQATLKIEGDKTALREQEIMIKHQERMAEIQAKAEKDANDFAIKMEDQLNKLTEMELKYNRDVPGSKV